MLLFICCCFIINLHTDVKRNTTKLFIHMRQPFSFCDHGNTNTIHSLKVIQRCGVFAFLSKSFVRNLVNIFKVCAVYICFYRPLFGAYSIKVHHIHLLSWVWMSCLRHAGGKKTLTQVECHLRLKKTVQVQLFQSVRLIDSAPPAHNSNSSSSRVESAVHSKGKKQLWIKQHWNHSQCFQMVWSIPTF